MVRFIVRRLGAAVFLGLSSLGCAAAGLLPEREVALAAHEWRQLRTALAGAANDLPIRSVRALQRGDAAQRLLEVELASAYLERGGTHRTWLRTVCSNGTGAWTCRPAEAVVEPASGGAVAMGAEVTPQDMLALARLLRHAPGIAACPS